MKLAAMARKVQTLKKRANVDPLVYFRPTLPQKNFIEDTSKLKILLGGNQVGKTWASAALLLMHALGRHPTIKGVTRGS